MPKHNELAKFNNDKHSLHGLAKTVHKFEVIAGEALDSTSIELIRGYMQWGLNDDDIAP